jgi:hypothetical protein
MYKPTWPPPLEMQKVQDQKIKLSEGNDGVMDKDKSVRKELTWITDFVRNIVVEFLFRPCILPGTSNNDSRLFHIRFSFQLENRSYPAMIRGNP